MTDNAVTKLERLDRFPGYRFTAAGEIISLSRKKPFAMKGMAAGKYRAVSLRRSDGQVERIYTHRVIAEAFHGPCPPGMECRHLDGNTENCRPENLRWGSRKKNAHDRVVHGTASIGEKHGQAKLTDSSVKRMRELRAKTGKSFREIADEFGVSTMTAHRAITKKLWRNV